MCSLLVEIPAVEKLAWYNPQNISKIYSASQIERSPLKSSVCTCNFVTLKNSSVWLW